MGDEMLDKMAVGICANGNLYAQKVEGQHLNTELFGHRCSIPTGILGLDKDARRLLGSRRSMHGIVTGKALWVTCGIANGCRARQSKGAGKVAISVVVGNGRLVGKGH